MRAVLLVFVGGGVGSALRYVTGRVVPAMLMGQPFPVAILLVNVLASGLLGLVAGWVLNRSVGEEVRLLVGVGFCGGLSTFSTFSYGTLTLLQTGRPVAALGNVILNVTLCLLASLGGLLLGART